MLAGTAVVVALPLVGTFRVSFLAGSNPQEIARAASSSTTLIRFLGLGVARC